MKSIISQIIVGIFKVVLPLFYILFILAGVACAIVTAVIGYETIQELFIKHPNVGIFSIPFLVVFSLEVTKVYIIFLNKQYSDGANEKYVKIKPIFLTARAILIGISCILTLLFTFYNLNNPEIEKRLEKETILINKAQDQQRTDIGANYDRQAENINTNYDNQIAPQKEEMKKQEDYRYSNGEFRGPEWDAANLNIVQLNQARNTALTENEKARTEALAKVETDRIAKIKDEEKSLNTDNASSNKMIHAMLSVVTFNPNYNKGYYLFAIFVLSILITIGLEFVIWSSFTVLAIDYGESFASDIKRNTIEEQVKGINKTVDAMHTAEVKSMKRRFNETVEAVVGIVKRKSKESIRKAKEDMVNIPDDET